MICADKIMGDSSIYALSKINNCENILSLNKNINNIEKKNNLIINKKNIYKINNSTKSFNFNIFEYYLYRNCFRIYYKKQFGLYGYGLAVIKNQLDIINVFNANFFFNILFKKLTTVKNNDLDVSIINI